VSRTGAPERWDWWNADEGDVIARVIMAIRDAIDNSNNDRQLDMLAMRAVYLDKSHDRYDRLGFHRERKSRYNLLQGAVDATHAQVVASRPRPKIITVAQDQAAQRKAVLRQRWVDGEYDRLDAYERLSELLLDALIYGTGALKVGPENGRTVVDRVWAGDLFVDPREERYHRVRTLYQIAGVDRDALKAAFPEHHEAIEDMPGLEAKSDPLLYLDNDSPVWQSPHQIGIIEAWRLPINDEVPGRHVIVANDLTLLDEPWTLERFPFVFMHWARDPQRFWGQGMVERGCGIQSDLNEMTEIIQEAYRMMVPQLYIDESAWVQGDVDDVVGRINFIKPNSGGIQGSVMVISPDVSPGLLQREASLADRLLPVLGVDVLAAKAEKPAGLNSGTALQNFHDMTSQRFLPQGRRYEQTTVDLAELLFYWADEMAKEGKSQTVRAYGTTTGLELIEWGAIKADDPDEIYEVRVKPGSALPKDPAGRIQTVFDMQALGLPLTPETMLELIEMPDTEAMADRLLAGNMLIRRAIEECQMDPDEVPQPTANAFWPRESAMAEITQAIQLSEYQNADEETMKRLRNLHGQLRNLPDPNAADVPPDQMGVATAPPAAPMPAGPPVPGIPAPVGPMQ
jgi:hypothetical protein